MKLNDEEREVLIDALQHSVAPYGSKPKGWTPRERQIARDLMDRLRTDA